VLKSVKRGDEMYPISPDLTYADTMKLRVSTTTTGGITIDATGAETFGTIVSLNESPVKPGYLYAGTDDGRLWKSENDGGSWTELTANVRGVPAGTYVSRIEPSHFDANRVYVSYDNQSAWRLPSLRLRIRGWRPLLPLARRQPPDGGPGLRACRA